MDRAGSRPDSEDVDYAWVMQVTFVLAIVVGVPVVAGLSLGIRLPTWEAKAIFALRVGAVVWFAIAVGVFAFARWIRTLPVGTDCADRVTRRADRSESVGAYRCVLVSMPELWGFSRHQVGRRHVHAN